MINKLAFLFIVICLSSCNTDTKKVTEEKLEKQSETNPTTKINDTIEKVKNIINISNSVLDFDSLPDNFRIYPKKYFDSIQANYLTNNLKKPIPMCKIFNTWKYFTSSVLNGTHLLKIQPKGNFEGACMYSPVMGENIDKLQKDSTNKSLARDTLLSGNIIIFTNYPLKCNDSLFVGVDAQSARIPILKDIKVGDNFKTLFKKLGYSYLKSKGILFYHDWKNTVAKFIIKDNTICEISVVRYDINISSDTLPSFIMNSHFIPEEKKGK